MVDTKTKEKVIKEHQRHETDTGSDQVQVAVLTEEIDRLALHLKKHKKDNHSRRGLLGMVARRRTLLGNLAENDTKTYKATIKKLGLKR